MVPTIHQCLQIWSCWQLPSCLPTVQGCLHAPDRRKLPAETLWPTNLEGGFVSLCSKTWVFLNSLSQVFTNSAPNTVLQYQRQPGPTTQQPFVNNTSNPALQSRSAPLAPLQNGPSPASKVSHSDDSTTVLSASLNPCQLP